jgi:hypothetical protein
MNSVHQRLYEVDCADPIETHCLQPDAKRLIFALSITRGKSNTLSGQTIFLGSSDVEEGRGFIGVSSFLWDRKVLTQVANL